MKQLLLFAGALFCYLTAIANNTATVRDDRLGVCTHFAQNWNPASVVPLIAGTGAAWIRDEIYWSDLEPTKGNYVFPVKTANWLNIAAQYGLKVVICFNYGNSLYTDHYDPVAYANCAG